MDALITTVRIPLGGIASVFLVLLGWPFEIVVGILLFPLLAMQCDRGRLKQKYRSWPFTAFTSVKYVWRWVFLDIDQSSDPDHPDLGTFLDRISNTY